MFAGYMCAWRQAILGVSMPKGPQGQKRPADTVANAIRVAKILTGEIDEDMGDSGKDKAAQALGKKGGAARRDKLTAERRTEIARKAAAKRWVGPRLYRICIFSVDFAKPLPYCLRQHIGEADGNPDQGRSPRNSRSLSPAHLADRT